jgi:uncharacterized protein
MIEKMSRRSFLRHSGAGVAAVGAAGVLPAEAAGKMPTRVLGKTGLKVSVLAFGGGSQFLMAKDGDWEPMIDKAISSGINWFDTSSGYQWKSSKSSEERFGLVLPRHRKSIYISTKFEERDPEKARREFERSLTRMKIDSVDLALIHSIEPDDDIAALEKGVYRMMLKLRDEKLTRFVGFSSMDSAPKSKEVLEKFEIDVTILAMNPTQYGDFAKVALPVARKKNVGVIAMKLMRGIVGETAKASELFHYAWTQPGVATAVVGHVGMQHLEENIRIAQGFTESQALFFDRGQLERRLAPMAGPHALCWARPGYRDSSNA